MFDGNVESIKLFFSGLIAGGASLIGISFKYIIVLIILMLVDTVFGWVKDKKVSKWKSRAAKWGFIGKIIELIFIVVLYILDAAFETDFLKYVGIFYFGACELASIVENYAEINGNLPDGAVEVAEKVQFSIGTVVMRKIKNIIDSFINNDREEQ